jgi:type IV pilus assembly protein PilC
LQYQYVAVNAKSKRSRGTIAADNKAEAMALLQAQGLMALELNGTSEKKEASGSIWQMEIGSSSDPHRAKMPKKKLLVLMQQMGIMMKAGVSLSAAMSVLIRGEKDKKVRRILAQINDDLYTGTPISAAMAKFRAFPEITVHIVQSGEANGRLDTAFERCAGILEKEITMSSKLRGAMGYPTFLLFLTLVLIIIMNTAVIPNFALVFRQFGAQLPLITRLVMAVSTFLITKWYWILLAVAALILTYRLLKRENRAFAVGTDRLKLRLPGLGRLLRESYVARFCRVLSSLVEAGVDIVHSLEIARDVIPNRYMQEGISEVAAEVRVGSSISASMAKFPVFDPLLVSMVQIGEESGMLFETMDKMATLYEEQTDASTKRFISMLEPTMTILIAVVVGTVVISIVMPMFAMYSVVAGG